MNCTKCGSFLTDNLRFCTECGSKLFDTAPNTPTPKPPALPYGAPQPSTPTGSLIGLTLDTKYRLDSLLGSGGMGEVFRTTRLLIGDTVALKVMNADQMSDPNAVERFRREAQAAARLKHPNAVSIYDFGVSQQGLVFLVMELVEGQSLRQILKQQGPLTPAAAAEIFQQTCAALDEAHKQQIIHRDIKPDNILVKVTASSLQVKVLDFGIAKMRDLSVSASNLTQTGSVVGTPQYMSPEQCLGEELDQRSDIYSLGIVLYEALTGIAPFNAPNSAAVVVQQVTQAPPPIRSLNPSLSPMVEAVVLHALEKRREARPQTAGALAHELMNAASGVSHPKTQGSEMDNASSLNQSNALSGMANTIQIPSPIQAERSMRTPPYLSTPYSLSTNEKPSTNSYSKGLFAFAILAFIGLVIMSYLYFFKQEKKGDSPNVASDTVRKNAEQGKSQEPNNTARGIPNNALQPTSPKPTPIESASISESTKSSVTITATASSTRTPFRVIIYSPENVMDGNMMTAWVEGVKGPGIGEWIQLNFDQEVRLRRIFIAPGYFKSPQIWLKNNRLAVVSMHFSNGSSREFRLPDQMEEQRIEVGEVRTDWVRIEIKQVYIAQSASEDTAISEIRFEWEP